MKKIFLLCILATAFALKAAFANAAASDWQDLGGGKARLVATLDPTSMQLEAALEVKLEPGWSTYWRYPGSSGIPPRFDFSGSHNLEIKAIHFPAPTLLGDKTGRYAGYKERVVFPVSGKIHSAAVPNIDLNLIIGVCSHICIPAQAKIKIESAKLLQSDPTAQQIINLAKMSVPRATNPETIVKAVTATVDRKLMITIAHEKTDVPPALFIEGPSEWYLQPGKLIERVDGNALFSVDLSRAPKDTDITAHQLKYTFVHGSFGVEFER
ncbi:MAG: protein-disulfide reductase DsbD domain-containing protein [Pseudomonadota bacterium]